MMPGHFGRFALVLLLVVTACGDSGSADTALSAQEGEAPAAAPTTTTGPWSPKTLAQLSEPLPVLAVAFDSGVPEGWYPEIWMQPADDHGEITSSQGVRFTGRGGSTRVGIMTEAGFDIGDYSHLVVAVDGVVLEQDLAGTGWHGREAPLAVLVTYVDVEGTEHVSLGEDPTIPTAMFFRGFTAIPEEGMVNGVEVTLGDDFSYEFDLMELDPTPVKILAVGVEGAGWDPRVGEVYQLTLTAGN